MVGLHSSDKAGPKFSNPSPTFSKSASAVSEITQPPSYEDAVKQVSRQFCLCRSADRLSGRGFTTMQLRAQRFCYRVFLPPPRQEEQHGRCSLWKGLVCVEMLRETGERRGWLGSHVPGPVPARPPASCPCPCHWAHTQLLFSKTRAVCTI